MIKIYQENGHIVVAGYESKLLFPYDHDLSTFENYRAALREFIRVLHLQPGYYSYYVDSDCWYFHKFMGTMII